MLARELITRENNIIERIIGQESETPLSAGPTGPLITSLFHVNVLHDINYLGGWPIGRIQREPLFLPPFLLRSFFYFLPSQFYFTLFLLTTRFNPFTADRGRSFDRDFHRTGKKYFSTVYFITREIEHSSALVERYLITKSVKIICFFVFLNKETISLNRLQTNLFSSRNA